MWGWITTAWEGVKGLFGGKGTIQIGQGNQAMTVGDIHFHPAAPQPAKDEDAEMFADLEQTMPDFLKSLRQELAEGTLIRDIIVLDWKSIDYNWPSRHLMYSEDENPDIRMHMAILEGHGLVTDLKGNGFAYRMPDAYRMSERLVRYLKRK
jgi:hypothetical protein